MLDNCLESLSQFAVQVFRFSPGKYMTAAGLGIWGFVQHYFFGTPEISGDLLEALILFVVLDFMSGIANSVIAKKVRISSAAMGRTLLKIFCYSTLILVAGIVDHVLGIPFMLTLLVLSISTAREGLSVLENVRSIYESLGYDWPFDFLADRLQQFQSRKTTEFKNAIVKSICPVDDKKNPPE